MHPTSGRIRRSTAGLVVIDLQERLLPTMHDPDTVVRNAVRLIRGATLLGVPVVATEQYRKGLGATVPAVREALGEVEILEKTTFSALGAPGFREALERCHVQDLVLCGIEAHVCVAQTGLDLLAAGYRPFVAADAVSSRTPLNHRLGLGRLRDAGAGVVSAEMALFEWLERAGTPEFKAILELVR